MLNNCSFSFLCNTLQFLASCKLVQGLEFLIGSIQIYNISAGEFNLATEHFEAYYKLASDKRDEWMTDEGQTLYSTACEHLRRLYTTIAQSSHVDDEAAQQEAIQHLQKAFEMAKESKLKF